MITFNNSDMSEPLAYIVENDVILAAIMRALKNVKNQVEIRYETNATAFNLPGRGDSKEAKMPYVKLNLNDGSVLKTKLLVSKSLINRYLSESSKS